MKHTIIACDLCGGRIYTKGLFAVAEGAISVTAKTLRELSDVDGSYWKRQKYHICPKCVEKLKEYCKSGGKNE